MELYHARDTEAIKPLANYFNAFTTDHTTSRIRGPGKASANAKRLKNTHIYF